MAAAGLVEFLHACEAEVALRLASAGPDHASLRIGHGLFRDRVAALVGSAPASALVASQGDRTSALPTVPVVDQLRSIDGPPLWSLAQQATPSIGWTPSPRLHDQGHQVALGLVSEAADLGSHQCGLLLMAPHARYPLHSHPPHEFYLPISGGGSWRYGGSDQFRQLSPDALIYNNPNDVHSVVAGPQVLLALYFLWNDSDVTP